MMVFLGAATLGDLALMAAGRPRWKLWALPVGARDDPAQRQPGHGLRQHGERRRRGRQPLVPAGPLPAFANHRRRRVPARHWPAIERAHDLAGVPGHERVRPAGDTGGGRLDGSAGGALQRALRQRALLRRYPGLSGDCSRLRTGEPCHRAGQPAGHPRAYQPAAVDRPLLGRRALSPSTWRS
jgi:hypothetical protein